MKMIAPLRVFFDFSIVYACIVSVSYFASHYQKSVVIITSTCLVSHNRCLPLQYGQVVSKADFEFQYPVT